MSQDLASSQNFTHTLNDDIFMSDGVDSGYGDTSNTLVDGVARRSVLLSDEIIPSSDQPESETDLIFAKRPFNIVRWLVAKIDVLSRQDPEHPIFGVPKVAGDFKLPLEPSGRANAASWITHLTKIGEVIEETMGSKLHEYSCWMVPYSRGTVKITENADGRVTSLRNVHLVRLIHFLSDPTEENWQLLDGDGTIVSNGGYVKNPFSHFCGNGDVMDGSIRLTCLNGAHHGRFASPEENESHKLCKNGALALCPGHGPSNDLAYCWFVHTDGELKPCRMWKDAVPKCTCTRKCF